jgi:hypothetical protein
LAVSADNGIFIYDRDFRLLRYRNIPSASGIWSSDGTKLLVGSLVLRADTLDVLLDIELTPHGWLSNDSQLVLA